MTATEPLTETAPLPALPEERGESTAPPVLTISADPFQVLPGGVITYSVAISNVADAALLNVMLSDPLPAGMVYVAQSALGFSYSPRDKRLTWAIERIEPGQGVRGGFQLRATGLGIGNLVWSRDPFDTANRETTFYYDRWFKTYPVCQRNALGHTAKTFYYGVASSESSNVPAECVTADGPASFSGNQFGQVYQTTDANAATTTYGYDALGRLTQVTVPPNGGVPGSPATQTFDYRPFSGAGSGYPFWILEKQRDGSGGDNYLYTWTYYDGFGRVLQRKAEADASGSTARHVETSFDYTWRDAVLREGVPRFVAAAWPWPPARRRPSPRPSGLQQPSTRPCTPTTGWAG